MTNSVFKITDKILPASITQDCVVIQSWHRHPL